MVRMHKVNNWSTVGIDGKDGIVTTGGNNPLAANGKAVTGLTNKTWGSKQYCIWSKAATEDR